MQITLIKSTTKYSIQLPEKIQGKYWLTSYDNGCYMKIIAIEAINGMWQLNADKYSEIVLKDHSVDKIIFDPNNIYRIVSLFDEEPCLLFAEGFDSNSTYFGKYNVIASEGLDISIGRENCDITYPKKYISTNHASLMFYKGKWSIVDHNSTNGTFVNNRKIKNRNLVPGDVIYIMGLTIIIGGSFIAINHLNEIQLNNKKFKKINPQEITYRTNLKFYEHNTVYFNRIPRFKKNISEITVNVDSVPKSQLGNETPFLLTLGPSITMGVASVATGIYSVTSAISNGNISSAIPTMIMSTSMLLGTLVWPFITKSYERKRNEKREAHRIEKYSLYLKDKKQEIETLAIQQKDILKSNVIKIIDCISIVKNQAPTLWDRNSSQDDFMTFRVGIGNIPIIADFSFPEEHFSLDEDDLNEKLSELRQLPKLIYDAPVSISLSNNVVTAVYGEKNKCIEFSKGLIVQATTFYGYGDVKIVLIFDKHDEKDLICLKWLPHVWNNEKNMRYIINDNESLRDLSSFFRVIFENRVNIDDNQRDNVSPFYLFFVYSKDLFERADFLGDIISCDKKINMSVITFFDDFNDVPKESTQVIALNHDKGKIFDINDTTGMFQDFKCDIYYHEDLLDYCHKLSNIKLNISSSYALPPVLTFLELFKSGKIDHLNVLERWQENDPTKSLKAEIGYDSYGDTMYLDLHQKYHGPHGLIAGMTGSGKSEFIMTFILSLAVNYHPYEVSFVLIDYKRGGMAKSFESLPHTAGIITNLDGSSIKRSLIAIESELTRRQAVFSSTAEKLGISNIDIYKYQKAYREGKVGKPMSHIFIIADEFAELKTQQPDFMAQLISAARIGRSLGVHLILATQKPSGVVDDQIWSNSKFRICLKVQDRADSMDMLKRPDAAALKETGRFYLQVGYNEMFVMGQSAWAGAPYVPSDTYEQDNKKEIVIVDTTGKEIIRSEFGDNQSIDSQTKQLDAITIYLHDVAEAENVHAQYLCLPPLPEFLLYNDLSKKYNELSSEEYEVKALVGELDDPARQRKLPFVVNFSGEGNALLYGIAGSGKENFITMLLYDLICRHSSEEINFYILDLGSETLKTFEAIPHVGGVLISGEDERFEKFFKMLKESFYYRKKLFADFGGSIQSYYEGSNKKIPNILVIINNFESFIEQYEKYSETLQFLTREGRRYGIFFLFSCVGTNAVRFKLMQNFKQLFVLQQNDITDYNAILGNTNGLIPSPVKGRGLVKYDETFEFQIALPTNERKLKSEISGLGKALLEMNMPLAKKISILPQYVTSDTFNDIKISLDHFPFGIYEDDLSTALFDFAANPFVCVSALQVELCQSFITSVFALLKKSNFEVIQTGISNENEQQISECENLINQFFNTMLSRHKIKKANESSSFDPLIVIINSFFDVYDKISVETKSLLEDALNQDISKYNIGIIIADSYDNVKRHKNKGWYKKSFKENGIWIGGGASSQFIFESENRLRDDSLPTNDFGFDFMGKDYKKVKLLSGG